MNIKFRVWSKILGIYFNWDELNYSLDGLIDNKYYVIQQFTGLLDREGKEIYEGDLVEICVGAPWDNEQPLDLLGELSFENGSWFFKGIKTNAEDDYLVNYETRTIKGNVFENSEETKK